MLERREACDVKIVTIAHEAESTREAISHVLRKCLVGAVARLFHRPAEKPLAERHEERSKLADS